MTVGKLQLEGSAGAGTDAPVSNPSDDAVSGEDVIKRRAKSAEANPSAQFDLAARNRRMRSLIDVDMRGGGLRATFKTIASAM